MVSFQILEKQCGKCEHKLINYSDPYVGSKIELCPVCDYDHTFAELEGEKRV